MAARLTRDFEARSAFEAKADALFLAYLVRRGTTPEALVRAHAYHFKQATRALEQREQHGINISDVRAMQPSTAWRQSLIALRRTARRSPVARASGCGPL